MSEQKIMLYTNEIMLYTNGGHGYDRKQTITYDEAIDEIYIMYNTSSEFGPSKLRVEIWEDEERVWGFENHYGDKTIRRYKQEYYSYRHTGVLDVLESFNEALEGTDNGR